MFGFLRLALIALAVMSYSSASWAQNATGRPAISGEPFEENVITAAPGDIADTNGITNASFTYTWLRCDVNGANCDTEAGTGNTYTLVMADVGTRFRLRANFTDDAGNAEARTTFPWPARSDPAIGPPLCPTPDLAGMGRTAVWTATMTVGQVATTTSVPSRFGFFTRSGTTYGSLSGGDSFTVGSRVSKYVKSHLIRKLKSPLNPSTEVACMFSLRTGGHPCSSEETI